MIISTWWRGQGSILRRTFSTEVKASDPARIFQLVGEGKVSDAIKLCDDFAASVKMSPVEFLSKQCSERSYLIYRLSSESRKHAFELAQDGGHFPSNVCVSELETRTDLWHEDVQEQYQRAMNCIHLSRTSLDLGSLAPARDYQIIGKSFVWRLLFGRTACILQTFMSHKLQESRQPHDFAIANHRKAARLFDEKLAPSGPAGPLEEPDKSHDAAVFQKFSEDRSAAAIEHMRLITHLTSDVARYLLSKPDGRTFLRVADTIITEDFPDIPEIPKYAKSVFKSTLRAL